jgi:hypothetical protein
MHPRTAELTGFLADCHATFAAAVNGVAPGHREQRPEDGRWSIAEIVDHVAVVDRRLERLLAAAIAAAGPDGPGPESDSGAVIPAFDTRRLTDRTRRVTSTEASRPRPDVSDADAMAAWRTATDAFDRFVAGTNGLALGTLHLPHPVFGRLDGYQWIIFAGAHELRHAEQVREVDAALRG